MDNIKETVESGIDAVTLDIPVRVTMTSYNEAPFEFTASIDEVGQIILTPVSKDVEFIDAKTDGEYEHDVMIIDQETITSVEGSITTKEFSIVIKANMLCENNNDEVAAVVDEIGQVVIYPLAKENVFVTASFEHSLNLVTEDMKAVDYFGYRLANNGDGWDVYDYLNELVEEGVATEAEAKIVACTTELHRLEGLTEAVEEPQEASDNEENTESESSNEEGAPQPDVTAEVIEEAVELSDEEKKQDLIARFLQGDIALFSDFGKPLDSYIHMPELDAKGYTYYYDEETDAIVSYPSAE